MTSEKAVFDELLLRITRAARFPTPKGDTFVSGSADVSSMKVARPTAPSSTLSQMYEQIARYFKEASQRRKRNAALAISLEDLHQILRYVAKELHTALWVSEQKKPQENAKSKPWLGSSGTTGESKMKAEAEHGHTVFCYESVADFVRQSPSYSIRALRSGLSREKGPKAGKFLLAHCFTEVVELCRAVDVKRDQSRRTVLGAIRLTTFVSVAVSLFPVVRLHDLVEEVAQYWSQEEFHADWTMAVVTFACMATMLANWAALDRVKATALRGLSDAILEAARRQRPPPTEKQVETTVDLKEEEEVVGRPSSETWRSPRQTPPRRPTLIEVVQEALQLPAHHLLLRSYPDAVMAAETPSPIESNEKEEGHGCPRPPVGPSVVVVGGGGHGDSVSDEPRPAQWHSDADADHIDDASLLGGGDDGPNHRVGAGRPELETLSQVGKSTAADDDLHRSGSATDTIDYDFWNAISSTPQRTILQP